MKSTTLRFGNRLYDAIGRAAARDGVTFAQYVREAAFIRVVWEGAAGIEPQPTREEINEVVLEYFRRELGT